MKSIHQQIWAIQTAFLGDCVLTLPALYYLLELNPKADVHVITGHAGKILFDFALTRSFKTFRDRFHVHLLDKRGRDASLLGLRSFAKKISPHPPDVVFCFQRSLRSGLLAWLSGAKNRIGFSSGAASFFYTQSVIREWNSSKSEIEKNLDLLRRFFLIEISSWNRSDRRSLLSEAGIKPRTKNSAVGLSLGSPWATKRWPIENAISFAKTLCDSGEELILLGDESAQSIGESMRKQVPSLLLKDLCGKTDIPSWVDSIASLKLLVSNDSAAVHVASDLGVPVVALFGPTLPEFGFAPWRKNSLALGVDHLNCRPCSIHGPPKCPLGHHKCLKEISGDSVANVVHAQLRRLYEQVK